MNSIYRTAVKGWREWATKWEPAHAAPATIGRKAKPRRSADLATLKDPTNGIYSAVRGLLVGREEGIIIHIVSATSGEGTSSIAKSLAKKAATFGNLSVFLMDGEDTGQGSAFAAIKTSKSYIRDHMSTELSVNDPSGIRPIYAACRKEYQLTIVDCPAIYSGKFFETMPALADGVVLVVEAEKLRPAMVRQAVEMVEQQGIEIFGIVLNKTRQYVPRWLRGIF